MRVTFWVCAFTFRIVSPTLACRYLLQHEELFKSQISLKEWIFRCVYRVETRYNSFIMLNLESVGPALPYRTHTCQLWSWTCWLRRRESFKARAKLNVAHQTHLCLHAPVVTVRGVRQVLVLTRRLKRVTSSDVFKVQSLRNETSFVALVAAHAACQQLDGVLDNWNLILKMLRTQNSTTHWAVGMRDWSQSLRLYTWGEKFSCCLGKVQSVKILAVSCPSSCSWRRSYFHDDAEWSVLHPAPTVWLCSGTTSLLSDKNGFADLNLVIEMCQYWVASTSGTPMTKCKLSGPESPFIVNVR